MGRVSERPVPADRPIPLEDLVRLRRVRDRIDREYRQPLDVPARAAGVGLSAGHLSRLFRRAYGESPYAYLMTRRIERAMTLLRTTDTPVTDVCMEVGFSSLGTFSRTFTDVVGVSPSSFRGEPDPATAFVPTAFRMRWTRPAGERGSGVSPDPGR